MKHVFVARFAVLGLALPLALLPAAAQQQQLRKPEPNWREMPFDSSPRAPKSDARPGDSKATQPEQKATAPAPTTIESLFERLAKAKDAPEASAIVRQIERRWMRSGSDTTDLLMTRAAQAMTVKDNDTALELFDFIIQLRPEWAEAYHRRATLLFTMNDYDGALRDINATLAREPRHYAAMSGLGLIMQQLDNKKAAYAAYKKAYEINPYFENLKTMMDRLKPEMEGQGI